jgi:hypothetical protein
MPADLRALNPLAVLIVLGAAGVSCSIQAKTVTCHNKSGHGFTIGTGKCTHV